jgi:hypothetical protein
MFGIEDPQIILAYLVTFGFTLACVLYGLWRWNKDGGD